MAIRREPLLSLALLLILSFFLLVRPSGEARMKRARWEAWSSEAAAAFSAVSFGALAEARVSVAVSGRLIALTFFHSINSGCPSWKLAEYLDRCSRSAASADFRAVLPEGYSDLDMRNFKLNVQLSFPAVRADSELSKAWAELSERMGGRAANGMLLLLSPNGLEVCSGLSNVHHRLSQDICPEVVP